MKRLLPDTMGQMLRDFLLRWLANGLGLWIAARLIPGIEYNDQLHVIVIAALIFSIVNALIRPILVVLSLPAIVLTLGLFMLVVNGFMLYLVTVVYPRFQIATFPRAIWAVMIVWLVNYAMSIVFERQEAHA